MAALVVSGCDNKKEAAPVFAPGEAPASDAEFLTEIGFDAPIAITVSLRHIFDESMHFSGNDNGKLVAVFAKAGLLEERPDPTGSTGWAFAYKGGTFSEGLFTVPVAFRHIAGRSDERAWKEGSVSYYEETISYSLDPTTPIGGAVHPFFQAGELRLVVMKEGATEHWQLVSGAGRGTLYLTKDAEIISKTLASLGANYVGDLADGVKKVRQSGQPTPAAAPSPNSPPTDSEMLSALVGFWKDRSSGWNAQLVTPIGASQADNAMTQNVMGTKVRTVAVTYTFRAKSDLTYLCLGIMGNILGVSPAPSAPENSFRNPMSAGGTFSCSMTVTAERMDEGWNIHPVSGDSIGYLFKR
jgi:hypothetical protein